MSEKKISKLKLKDQGDIETGITGLKVYTLETDKHKTFAYIEPGIYKLTGNYTQSGIKYMVSEMEIVSDKILDLPSKEYVTVTRQIGEFLKSETRAKYKELDYVYKRSILLYGRPGTGKTCLINRIAADIVKVGGLVLFADYPSTLSILDTMFCVQNQNSLAAVILEEFDKHMRSNGAELLTLLDGQIQRDNTMYLCTTNYIEKIPARILRPGRINIKIEVQYPDIEARLFYLMSKIKDIQVVNNIAEKTEGLSIDELKEVVQCVLILNEDLDATIDAMHKLNVQIRLDELNKKDEVPGILSMLRGSF